MRCCEFNSPTAYYLFKDPRPNCHLFVSGGPFGGMIASKTLTEMWQTSGATPTASIFGDHNDREAAMNSTLCCSSW